jgi:hypothetical protein
MIKNYEEFVNEGFKFKGFLDSVITGIETGISGYKTVRKADAAVEAEAKKILASGNKNVSEETQMSILFRKLITSVAILADNFTSEDERITKDAYLQKVENIEKITARMKELLKKDKVDIEETEDNK